MAVRSLGTIESTASGSLEDPPARVDWATAWQAATTRVSSGLRGTAVRVTGGRRERVTTQCGSTWLHGSNAGHLRISPARRSLFAPSSFGVSSHNRLGVVGQRNEPPVPE